MEADAKNKIVTSFLSGGGEMGEVIKTRDWSSTGLGPIDQWPQSLCTTLSITLRSKIPMVLIWGEEQIFFYNDAYKPTLGNENPHYALGTPASNIWKDSWETVRPLIERVYNNSESFNIENQLIPIYRNGKWENVFWSFSYSPIADETGQTSGVFITCSETTEQMAKVASFEENSRTLDLAMEIAELGVFKVDLQSYRATYSHQIMNLLDLKEQNMLLSDVIKQIHPDDQPTVSEVIEKTIEGYNDGKHDLIYRVKKPNEIKYLHSIGRVEYKENKPVAISGIIQDVTQQILSQKVLEDKEKAFRNLVMLAPVAIAVILGKDFVVNIVNDAFLSLIGKKRPEFDGQPFFDALPETEWTMKSIAEEVRSSGQQITTKESKLKFIKNGREEVHWFSTVWEPHYSNDNKIIGVMLVIHEVTEQVLARKKIEESEGRYKTLIEESTVATGLYIGENLEVKYANDILLGYWGKNKSVLGKPLREAVPELIGQPFLGYLSEVYKTGVAYEGHEEPAELLIDDRLQTFYFNFTYKPLRNQDGEIYGIHHIAIDVTGEVLARRAVKEREEQLRIAIEGAELGTYNFFPQQNKAIWSAKTKEFYGLPPEAEITYELYMKAIHPEDRAKAKAALEGGLKNPQDKGYYQNEYRTIGIKDGKLRWIRPKGRIFFDHEGRPVRITGVIQDVTEQKKAEEALKVSKDRFQAAVEAIEGVLWTNNAKGEMEGVQPGWEHITGQTYEEYQGYGWAKAVHPDDAQATIEAWEKAVHKKEIFVFEHRHKLKDGSWGYFSIRAIPLFNADGSLREWVGVHTNITDQKLAELALKESEARFRSLADQSPMFVFIVEPTPDASISFFNKTWFKYTGQNEGDAIGTGWIPAIHPDDLKNVSKYYTLAYQNQVSYTIPAIRVMRHDGEYRWHMFKGNPRHLSDGSFIGFVGVGIDIHEQKLAINKLEENNTQLIRINNDLDNFIYTASHDLKAPMSNIEGLLNALRSSLESQDEQLNEDTEAILEMMDQSVNKFQATILDLSEISRVQREAEEDFNEVNLGETIEDVKISIQDQLKKSNASIKVDVSSAPVVKFSRKNIKSVIYNLLSNAIKYRHPDRPPEVTVKTKKKEKYIVLSVTDNGLGIPEKSQGKVFSMFKRLHDHVDGTGIGLYIVKRVIDNAGGKIEVESEEGRGTTFKVYFKVA
ncbi:PAS domain S-box protein [Cytophagaceae bacterium ABcell3]|nr:PAS domain S-box protein [Cytophagaceae bacterium ABcell3]